MRTLTLLILLTLFNLNQVMGQGGRILENEVMNSSILKEGVLYNIYLPPNYEPVKRFPVIYHLHGFGGDNNSSNAFMQKVDSLIISGDFPETIIIAPNGKKSWYIDDYVGKYNYSTMFIQEFIPFIKEKYPISTDVSESAIMGISMGGYGALRFTMLYPDKFGICISFMAGISTKEQIGQDSKEDYDTYHQELYGKDLKPLERANEFFIKNNPLYIAQKVDPNNLKRKKWFIQVCDNDYHSLPNSELHNVFYKLNIEHEFRVLDGGHSEACFQGSINEALDFIKNNMI